MASYLILGGKGFIGTALQEFLISEGHLVETLDLKNDTSQDLRHINIANLPDFDGVFFLAWNVGGSKYLTDITTWPNQFQDNILLIGNVFPQLIRAKTPFLFVSSQLAGTDNSPYSLSKQLAESYCATQPQAVVARQWNVYGSPEEFDIKSHVISDFVWQAIHNRKIKLITDGSEKRKFIHLEDTARAYLQMLQSFQGQIFDVSGGNFVTIYEVAELVAELTGATVERGSGRGFTPNVRELSTVPGWNPEVSLEAGITRLISRVKLNLEATFN